LFFFNQADNDLTELKSLLESSSQSLVVSTSFGRNRKVKIMYHVLHSDNFDVTVFMAISKFLFGEGKG
jgi:hypothetical protein